MKAQTTASLVHLAQDKLEDLQYLSHVSEQMRAAVDMACVVEGIILPVHSYVLMSPLLWGDPRKLSVCSIECSSDWHK